MIFRSFTLLYHNKIIRSFLLILTLIVSSSIYEVRAQQSDEAQPHIIGGTPVADGQYPSFVWLNRCGATLIHADIVLTAAQCLLNLPAKAKIGGINANGIGSQTINIVKKIPHPFYRGSPHFINDVMLLKLAAGSYSPIQLLNYDNDTIPSLGSVVTTIGLGYTSLSGTIPTVVHEVDTTVLSTAECQQNVTGTTIRVNQHICTAEQNKGVQLGDGGGPLLIRNYDNNKSNSTYIQVGITSFIKDSTGSNNVTKAVFARTSHFERFIKRNICRYSSFRPDYC